MVASVRTLASRWQASSASRFTVAWPMPVLPGSMLDEDGEMKRSTAIRHLEEMAETASERLRLRETDFGWPLEELWVDGDLLGLTDTLESGSVVLVLDLPADEMPWLAMHPTAEWVGGELRLGKRPMAWCYRPLTWPVWNHEHRRLARFWSAAGGMDTAVIEGLRSRRLDALSVAQPTSSELSEQLSEELVVSRRHLRSMLGSYWDRDWRRKHNAYEETPEDHLWRAAMAVSQIEDALEELTG